MFIDNYKASENETDQEVAQTYDARNKIAKTVCFEESSQYNTSLKKPHHMENSIINNSKL